jgi:hypothetical protein
MTSGPDAAVLASPVIRQALVPMAAFYLILMAGLGLGLLSLRRRGAGQASGPAAAPGAPRGWAALTRHVLGTTIGGYLLLQAVIAAYYYGVARVGGAFLYSAVTGTALLIGLSMPVFAAASWISARTHGRCGKPGKAQPPPQ